MKIKYFAPSYKRPEKSSTQKMYPEVTLVVSEDEAEEYKKNGNVVITCPNEIQGNLCRVRNWIIDEHIKDYDCIVLMDDDNSGVFRWENQEFIKLRGEEFYEEVEKCTILCKDYGYYFWGMNCMPDKGAYMEHTPFGTTRYIGGPFQCIMNGNELRYDETLPLKEDYDYTLQNLLKYGGALRFNYLSYRNKQSMQPGGCSAQRNTDREREQFDLLQKKWGSDIIQVDSKSKKDFDYNPIMKTPLRGV